MENNSEQLEKKVFNSQQKQLNEPGPRNDEKVQYHKVLEIYSQATSEEDNLSPDVTIKAQTAELVKNIAEFFEHEKRIGRPLYLNHVRSRLVAATGVSFSCIQSIVNSYHEHKTGIKTSTRKVRQSKYSNDFINDTLRPCIATLIKKNPSCPVSRLRDAVENELNLKISHTTFWSLMRKCGFNYGDERNVDDFSKSFNLYMEKINQYRADDRHIVYVGQTWFCQSYVADKTVSSGITYATADDNEDEGEKDNNPERIGLLHAASYFDGFILNAPYIYRVDKNSFTRQVQEFEQWFEFVLIPKIPENCVVVLDIPDDQQCQLPTINSYKRDLVKWLNRMNIPHDVSLSKLQLFETYVQPNLPERKLSVDDVASKRGVDVMRLPTVLEDFNPFRYILKKLKFNVSKKFVSLDLNDLASLIEQELTSITIKDWKNAISRVKILESSHSDEMNAA